MSDIRIMQLTIDEAIERATEIDRLTRSMERWRSTELDRILPDDYAYYMQLLDHLKAGGAYVRTEFDPHKALFDRSLMNTRVGHMVQDIGAGLARICRTYRRPR